MTNAATTAPALGAARRPSGDPVVAVRGLRACSAVTRRGRHASGAPARADARPRRPWVDDRFSYDEDYLRAKLRVLLSGRAAERLVYGTVTTGAESDVTEATELARHMAGACGMSEAIGPSPTVPACGPAQPLPAGGGSAA